MTKINKVVIFFATFILGTCLCLGCFLALSAQLYKALDRPTADEGQERANELIKALEQYKSDAGSYPSDLDLLIPKYLTTVPQPAWGAHYGYELLSNEDEFTISFDVGISMDGDYCEYESWARRWHCSDRI
ncbi:MAG: hypothetical protein HY863_09415 [Chloroflexi bacterium]|nr:hypothetical protein [Chloroflexota bacterium]